MIYGSGDRGSLAAPCLGKAERNVAMKLYGWVAALLVLASSALATDYDYFDGIIANVVSVRGNLLSTLGGWLLTNEGDLTISGDLDVGGAVTLDESAEVDTMTVNDVFNFFWAGGDQVFTDYASVDSTFDCGGVATFSDTVNTSGLTVFPGLYWSLYNAAGAVVMLVDSAGSAEIEANLVVGDTLGVNCDPEHLFEVYNPGAYSMFRGDSSGTSYVASNTDADSAEVGFALMRKDTLRWTVEDSNGTFIVYQADSSANRMSIDPASGNVSVFADLGVTHTIVCESLYVSTGVSLVGATDTVAWYDFIAADTLQAIIIRGRVDSITEY